MPFLLFRSRRAVYSPARMILAADWKCKCTPALTLLPNTLPSWPEDIFAILQRFDVRQVPYVPDAGHSQLIERVLAPTRCAAFR